MVKAITAIGGILLIILLANMAIGLVVWILWEEVLHAGLGWPRLGFWQCVGLVFLLGFFASFFRSKK